MRSIFRCFNSIVIEREKIIKFEDMDSLKKFKDNPSRDSLKILLQKEAD